jgi:hypothetical protein
MDENINVMGLNLNSELGWQMGYTYTNKRRMNKDLLTIRKGRSSSTCYIHSPLFNLFSFYA